MDDTHPNVERYRELIDSGRVTVDPVDGTVRLTAESWNRMVTIVETPDRPTKARGKR